ncbi:MAG: PQQ-binding-like beta-propeller repeat protein [Saprospiraceae bacterium]|nr:PQQ-binding-like beta-propeller repeat protein [Saprospiraceae bacterium]
MKITRYSFILAVISIWVFLFNSIDTKAQSADFSNFRGGPQHPGYYQTQGVHHSPRLKWSFKTEGSVQSAPAIKGNQIFFGSADGNFYAVDIQTGTELWRFKTTGSIASSPSIAGNLVYFTSRDQHCYAVDTKTGKLAWKFDLGKDIPYDWAFDNILSSPTILGAMLYIGSGDGHVYALDSKHGKVKWKFKTQGRVRSSAAVDKNVVYIGDTEGYFYALNAANGQKIWAFETEGIKFKNDKWGFDRKAVISSPVLTDELVIFGCRDGFMYAVDRKNGHQVWRMDHQVSWVMSSPAIANGKVFAGSSDGQFVQAVDLKNGQELWRFEANAVIWSSPTVVNGMVYIGCADNKLYALNAENGEKIWRFRTNARILATPVVAEGVVYCGSDDGYFYAISGESQADPAYVAPEKAVFWKQNAAQGLTNTFENYAKDYLSAEGYTVLDTNAIEDFLRKRIQDRKPSVVVFPTQLIPASIAIDSVNTPLIRQYLNAGGKVVLLNALPTLVYVYDPATGQPVAIDFSKMEAIFGIRYYGKDTRGHGGTYHAAVTGEGKKWGLRGGWLNRCCSLDPKQVSAVLATDERGNASAWVKNYGGREGTGLVQLRYVPETLSDMASLLAAIEFGL